MSTINDGGQAFPFVHAYCDSGMSLRDWFAGQAVHACYAEICNAVREQEAPLPPDWREGIASEAFKMADAMIAERSKRAEGD